MNRTVEQVLRAHAAGTHTEWDKTLKMAEFAINSSIHTGLQATPFFLNTGREAITPLMLKVIQYDKITCDRACMQIKQHKDAFDHALQHLKVARDRYKSYADAKRQDVKFQKGQEVLLSTVNLNRHSMNRKLYPKFVGPFLITEVVNDTSYRLELPKSMPVHDVFHVSLLKEHIPSKMRAPPPLPIEVDGELEYEVSRILTHREIKCRSSKRGGSNLRKEYLIEWLGYGAEHNTWEQESNLTNCSILLKVLG
jgi:hypothetical protein